MGMKWTLDKRKYLDTKEVKKLLCTLKREMKKGVREKNYILVRNWFAVLVGLHTGLRVSEIADLVNKDILIYDSCAFILVRKGKGEKERMVRVSDEFIKEFQKFTQFKQSIGISTFDETPVICKKDCSSLSVRSFQLAFKKCAEKAGLDSHYSIHCLRHSFGTHLYKASGNNIRFVQKQLGHSNVSTTQIYADVINEEAEKAMNRLYK